MIPQDAAIEAGEISFERDGRDYVMHARQWLPADAQTIWAFVADCRHMNHVIPSFMQFDILNLGLNESPPAIAPGVEYEYRLRLHGVGVFWRTHITEVEYPRRFVDTQAAGPYAHFSHLHTFEPQDGGTLTTDVIHYRPPGGPLARLVDAAMVRRDLRKLFECRHRRMAELFADGGDPATRFFVQEPVAVS
ncbi:MAG: SRPBCC family protein [Planctomycetota bacterium]